MCAGRRYRLRHGAAALTWDAKLAAAAQAWADSCPWSLSDSVYGENIAWGYNSFGDAVEAWYSEVRTLGGVVHTSTSL